MFGSSVLLKNTASLHTARFVVFLSRLAEQAVNYFSLITWLLHSACKGRASKVVSAIVLNVFHLSCQGAAIFAIYWWARKMETNGIVSVPLLSIHFAPKDEHAFLWAVVIFSAACFIASACFLFLSRLLVLNIVKDQYARSLENMVLLTSRLPDPRAPTASQLFMRYGFDVLANGCRRGALTAIIFANAITAVVGGVGAAAFLIGIAPLLTLSILLGAILGAALLYPLALRAAKLGEHRKQAKVAFRQEIRRLERSSAQRTLKLDTSDTLAHAFLFGRRVEAEFTFAIQIGVTVILILVVYYMANQATGGMEKWAIVIAYIGALRLALAGFSQAIGAFARVSRYYPQIIRYHVLIKNAWMIDKRSLGKVRRGESITLGTLRNGADIAVSAGQRLALATTDTVHQIRSALLYARKSHAGLPLGTAVIDGANRSIGDATVALVDLDPLTDGLDEQLPDLVTLIIHRSVRKIGSYGETHLLSLVDGKFRHFAPLGTTESDVALEEFSHKSAKLQKKRIIDAEEDDDDDDE